MKEKELRELATCCTCGRKVGESPLGLFYKVTIEPLMLDVGACSRQQGLTMLLGGHAEIAYAMGTDEDLAKTVMDPVTVMVCEPCALDTDMGTMFNAAMERSAKKEEHNENS